jgi:hypothetical protein
MFIVQLGLLVCMASQGHLHQKNYVLCHHTFGKTQPKKPHLVWIKFKLIYNNLVPLYFHDLDKFCEF